MTLETRGDVLRHYKELRKSVNSHLSGSLKYLRKTALMEAARAIGIVSGIKTITSSFDEMQLACDVAVYGRKPDERLRAIDRYARHQVFEDRSIDAITLSAVVSDRFTLIKVRGRHHIAGLMVEDINRHNEMWLMDEGFEATADPGLVLGARIIKPTAFCMTAGGAIPINPEVISDALSRRAIWLKNKPEQTLEDPRFPAALYSAAIRNHVMDNFQYTGSLTE